MGRRANVSCLCLTVLVTLATTVVVGVAVLSDYWEIVRYSSETVLSENDSSSGGDMTVEVLFDGKVVVVKSQNQGLASAASTALVRNSTDVGGGVREVLVQMHGGLWTICFDLTDEELETLESLYPNSTGSEKCLNHMKERELFIKSSPRAIYSRQLRMQNLAISCSVVCLIILVACLLVFWVGLIERQVPPILVVSVLYLLAAVFAVFSLSIAQYRRQPSSVDCGPLDARVSDPRLLPSRTFAPSWSAHLGWAGVGCCCLSAACVYGLSTLMRNGPFSIC